MPFGEARSEALFKKKITPIRRNKRAFMGDDYASNGSVGEKSRLHSPPSAARFNECNRLITTIKNFYCAGTE
jgi:hypothetical protein